MHSVKWKGLNACVYMSPSGPSKRKDTTILVLGTGTGRVPLRVIKQVRDINQFVHRGGRLVFSLLPTPRRSYWDKRNERLMNERGDDIRREYRNRKKDKRKGEKRKTDDDDADDSQETISTCSTTRMRNGNSAAGSTS